MHLDPSSHPGATAAARGPDRQATASPPPPRTWRRWLIGRPLPTADAPHQTIGKRVGLAIFASDALSSTAYATQEIMLVLAVAGAAALGYVFPISIAIATLLLIVTISYEQIIHAYPNGGGAYVVAHDNLGELPALTAGAALLLDYILTVAVSVSSAVAQIASASPALSTYRVEMAIFFIAFMTLVNLRGVRESGTIFAIPSYFFIVMLFLTVGVGLFRYFSGTLPPVENAPTTELLHAAQAITPFLLLRAFSNGTTALTGVEAISNGTTAFREPRARNAGITLLWMSAILGALFIGLSFLAPHIGATPSESETVISQLARTVFAGRGPLYLAVIFATTLILILAANTSFNGFPRLGAIMAQDGFLPRQLAFRGSRLVYSSGIVALAVLASLLIIFFRASVSGLIPLYAIGVFLSFTLAQAGMTRRWWRLGRAQTLAALAPAAAPAVAPALDRSWRMKMASNAIGALVTALVMLVFAVTKFREGAWLVLVLIPALVMGLLRIQRHYQTIAASLSLDRFGSPPPTLRHRVILPLSGVHQGTLAALRYAHTLSDDITAVHVSIDPDQSAKVQAKWRVWGEGVRLVVLESPYRLLLEPLLDYIEEISRSRQPNETITIVVPHFVPDRRWQNLLHTQAASLLRAALLQRPGIIVTEVPYQVLSSEM